MLFNSVEFIFGFLPVTFALFFLLARASHRLAALWLTIASLFFYGWWDARYLWLLGSSIGGNFLFGSAIARATSATNSFRARALLIFAISANLLLLGYYKYANFFVSTLAYLDVAQAQFAQVILPLGISFFTFTQVAFLVDAYHGRVKEYDPVHYTLFVTYFPHLIAGPVLHHKEMMPQFSQASTYSIRAENVAVGSTIFLIGLFKKTVLADGVAPYATPAFSAAKQGEMLSFFEAWSGALAYTLQLYFDFSGYSDMAIGLSRLFGVQLPLNFNSPYRAVNIIDFWRRWHMTLSRFLRDYLYVPLGGNRQGAARRYLNLFITMVLGGLWHGAGWTFVAWGALHGAYLMVNHGWIAFRRRIGLSSAKSTVWGRFSARCLTLLAVIVGWVFFRAESFEAATRMLAGMFGFNGVSLPAAILGAMGSLGALLRDFGVREALGGGMRFVSSYLWIIGAGAIALFAPNTQQLLDRFSPALDHVPSNEGGRFMVRWQPTMKWSIAVGLVGAIGLLSMSRVSEFLYFQF